MKRTTLRLIHLETAHERFVTTPEHPFATRDAGWVRAGDLRPGDLLISGRHGPIPVSSIRNEVLAQPVPVFNLTVDRTHAYLVGSGQVLVHNVRCGEDPLEAIERRLHEANRDLNAARREGNVRLITSLRDEIDRLRREQHHARRAREREEEARQQARVRRTEVIQRIVELRSALANNLRNQQALRAAQRGEGTSSGASGVRQQLAELKRQHAALLAELAELRVQELQRGVLKDSGWMHGTKKELAPAHLEELRNEIARGGLSYPRLAEIERELARSEPVTQEFLNAIWRAIAKADARPGQDPIARRPP